MTFNFDQIFEKPDWDNIYLTDNPPCATCKHKINLRELHPGNTWDNPPECEHCIKRYNYVINCIQKLAYLENKARKEKKSNETSNL